MRICLVFWKAPTLHFIGWTKECAVGYLEDTSQYYRVRISSAFETRMSSLHVPATRCCPDTERSTLRSDDRSNKLLVLSMTGPRVAVITTSPLALRVFFLEQLRCIAAHGFDVHGIASPGKDLVEFSRRSRLPTYGVSMRREPSIIADFRSLLRLFNLVRRLKPQIVQTHTPKAGLLGMLAAFLAGVPVRIYTVNGLVLQSRSGWQRKLLSMTEWLGCAFSTQVLCVSHSLRRDVVAQGLCPAGKIKVLGHGGSHGVDLAKFSAGTFCERERSRTLYRIPAEALVMAFVGRFTRDKGLKELAASWSELRGDFPSLRLILCGQPEVHDAVPAPTMSQLVNDPRVHFIDAAPEDMPAVYSAVDLVVLPSYREGLPNVALECGAMKIPIVATRVAGCFGCYSGRHHGAIG